MPGAGLQGFPAAYRTVQVYKALLVSHGRHARRAWPVAGRTKPALHIAAHCASASEGACSTGPSIRAEHPALLLRPAISPQRANLAQASRAWALHGYQQCGQVEVLMERLGTEAYLDDGDAHEPKQAPALLVVLLRHAHRPLAVLRHIRLAASLRARDGSATVAWCALWAHWSGKHKQAQLFLAAPPWPLPVPRWLRRGALSCQTPDGALAWGFAGEVREAGLYKQASRVECKQGCTPPRQLLLLHRRRLSVKDIPAHCRTTSCQLSLTGHVHNKRCCGSLQVGGPCRTQA